MAFVPRLTVTAVPSGEANFVMGRGRPDVEGVAVSHREHRPMVVNCDRYSFDELL